MSKYQNTDKVYAIDTDRTVVKPLNNIHTKWSHRTGFFTNGNDQQ
jgi:hypothetical protein